jgi:hypothetical protein
VTERFWPGPALGQETRMPDPLVACARQPLERRASSVSLRFAAKRSRTLHVPAGRASVLPVAVEETSANSRRFSHVQVRTRLESAEKVARYMNSFGSRPTPTAPMSIVWPERSVSFILASIRVSNCPVVSNGPVVESLSSKQQVANDKPIANDEAQPAPMHQLRLSPIVGHLHVGGRTL